MLAYIARRLLLIVPTLFGIMLVNFVITQAAPGGPIEQVIADITRGSSVTGRFTGAGGDHFEASRALPNCRRRIGGAQPLYSLRDFSSRLVDQNHRRLLVFVACECHDVTRQHGR